MPVGETVVLHLSIGNTSGVIDGYTVRVFGLDPEWVAMEPDRLSLFPGDAGTVAILLRLPDGVPGRSAPGQRATSRARTTRRSSSCPPSTSTSAAVLA